MHGGSGLGETAAECRCHAKAAVARGGAILGRMGYWYFRAPDDAAAAALIDSGPNGGSCQVNDVDPAVALGTLESLLTAAEYDDLGDDERRGGLIASADGYERLVLSVTDGLRDALVMVDEARVDHVASAWVVTEELAGAASGDMANVIRELAALSRHAKESGQHLYYWALT